MPDEPNSVDMPPTEYSDAARHLEERVGKLEDKPNRDDVTDAEQEAGAMKDALARALERIDRLEAGDAMGRIEKLETEVAKFNNHIKGIGL